MLVNAQDFKISVPALLFDPAFYVFDFEPKNEFTKLLVVDEAMLDKSPFIDIRFEPLAQAQFWVNTRDLFALEGQHDIPRPQPVFIFHHAFVCSTLLARCLNEIDAFFSLKEPWVLRRMADFKRTRRPIASDPQWREMFCKYVMLLCRNFRGGRVPVIKATNVANNLLADVLQWMPGQGILYLYSDLESFLISNLKKASDTQQKMPALAQAFLGDGNFALKFPQIGEPSQMSFLQVCALIWLVNLHNFREVVERHGHGRVRSLDAQSLLQDLAANLGSLSRFFGHAPQPAELQRMMNPQVIQTNAKDQSKPYGLEQRLFETNQIRGRYGQELQSAIKWINPLVKESGVLEFLQSCRLAQ